MFDIKSKIDAYKKCQNFMSFDVETASIFNRELGAFFPYHGDRIFSFCLGNDDYCDVYRIDKPYYAIIEMDKLLDCIQSRKNIHRFIEVQETTIENNIECLRNIFKYKSEKLRHGVVIHNCKFEKGFLAAHGIRMPDDLIVHDPMLMSRLLDNQSPSHELGRLTHRLGGDPLGKMIACDKKVEEEVKRLGGYEFVNVPLMTEYQLYDAIRPLLLHDALWPEIQEREKLLEDYIWEIQTALCTQEIEEEGITVHEGNCHKLIGWLDGEIEQMQHECFNIIGEYINMSSPKQIERVLFKKLGFPVITFSDTGAAKTDKDTVFKLAEEYDHPFLDLLLKWRSYTDGKTSIQKYIDLMDENGKIHTTINTCQARTHRQSSKTPNMQNVSKEAALKNKFPVPARQCFRCGD